jgi:hypothetical protein
MPLGKAVYRRRSVHEVIGKTALGVIVEKKYHNVELALA